MRSAWRYLKLPNLDSSIPPLMIKYHIRASEYSVWVTDLCRIWEEVIDRKRIIQRSINSDTSIDASEGPDQLRLLLQSIERALKQQADTDLNIARNHDDGQLILRTLTPLPVPLKPLDWVIELSLGPQSRLTAELIIPMFGNQINSDIEKTSLLQIIKEKDQILTKLIDKIQSNGTDFAKIFPGVTSSKNASQNSREVLGRSIKGLGFFDEQHWQNDLRKNSRNVRAYAHLVETFANKSEIPLHDVELPNFGSWWEQLRNKDSQQLHHSGQKSLIDGEAKYSPGDFQRQPTPLQSSPSFIGVRKTVDLDVKAERRESTTDESDLDVATEPYFGKKKIDIVGSPEASAGSSSSNSDDDRAVGAEPTYRPEASLPLGAVNDQGSVILRPKDKDVEEAREHLNIKTKLSENREEAANRSAPKPKGKLGRIGGKPITIRDRGSQLEVRSDSPAASNNAISSSLQEESQSPRPFESKTNVGRAKGKDQPQVPSPPRESSRDRADKKREQLKRELESKSAAGARKKRRF